MSRTFLLSMAILVGLIAGTWWLGSTRRNAVSRETVFTELTKAADAYREAVRQQEIGKIMEDLYRKTTSLGDPSLTQDMRNSLLEANQKECEAEVQVRDLMRALEKKVKDNVGEPMPQWFTQNRDWQIVDEHLRKSRFRPPANGCQALYERIKERR